MGSITLAMFLYKLQQLSFGEVIWHVPRLSWKLSWSWSACNHSLGQRGIKLITFRPSPQHRIIRAPCTGRLDWTVTPEAWTHSESIDAFVLFLLYWERKEKRDQKMSLNLRSYRRVCITGRTKWQHLCFSPIMSRTSLYPQTCLNPVSGSITRLWTLPRAADLKR